MAGLGDIEPSVPNDRKRIVIRDSGQHTRKRAVVDVSSLSACPAGNKRQQIGDGIEDGRPLGGVVGR